MLQVAVFIALFSAVVAFVPSQVKFGANVNGIVANRQPSSELGVYNPDKSVFDSKLMPPFTEDELNDLLKEFNVTNFDINKDPELAKWAPSKQFFEKFGFQNNTERYQRKVQDVKMEFYSEYTKPILPQYKTFLSDLMTVTFVQRMDSRYVYDPLHAFGICTQYYTIMKGYALQDEIDVIFNTLMKASGFDPVKIRDDAKLILNMVKESTEVEEKEFLTNSDNELGKIFQTVANDRFFKYTDAWGVGLGRVMELRNVEPNKETFDRWTETLRWVFTPRLMQSWDEFCNDQLRMQGVEAMQKQLLIREKKRAAARLESKALAFDDKKKALQELNEAIDERRAQLIQEQKEIKKKYEPEAYEKILLKEEQKADA
mmetsp:Transcript_10720/g.17488  ORF Transcript_10720/g.17488 Transcript_10720/m.17488 type:complete len:372 (-) Transcript_10720:134-1249(-)